MENQLENAFAMIIGVGNDLPVTVADAIAIYNILVDPELSGYKKENIILLTEEKATRKGILDGFDELKSKTNETSSVLLYYSGHGGFYEPWNQFYLVPNNFDSDNYEETWVKAEELKEKVSTLDTDKLVFLLDCCHAAGMTKNEAQPAAVKDLSKPEELARKIEAKTGMGIISSCREDQLSWILEGDSNSLFTKCLIEVLRGEHKENIEGEYIRISEVLQYIFKKVPERKSIQNPYANLVLYEDFYLSYVPKGIRKNVSTTSNVDLGLPDILIREELAGKLKNYQLLVEKQNNWVQSQLIQHDTAHLFTLEKQLLEMDEKKAAFKKEILELQQALKGS